MGWNKKGPVFCPDNDGWMASHATMPAAFVMPETIRVFFSSRNSDGKSEIGFVDVDRNDPTKVVYVHDQPVLSPGNLGTFDDSGVQPNCVLENDGRIYLYYLGWNPSISVMTRNNTGLAISEDGGTTFKRAFKGPVLDRTLDEPHYAHTPHVMKDGEVWRAWYASGTEWASIEDRVEGLFHIKCAESADGIHWKRDNVSCIPPLHEMEVSCKPSVIKQDGLYRMWFSVRGAKDFRGGENSYRIGYADSKDGIQWERDDKRSGIDVTPDSWDSDMVCYCSIVEADDKFHMFYNGNGFGKTGFGYAVLEPSS